MKEPKLSKDFTMEDLYKLREYNSWRYVNMTTEEMIEDIRKGANEAREEIARLKEEKSVSK